MDQLGFFNMGEFIGDPRQRFTQAESYPDLDALRNAYFEKYVSNYDLNDYIRLIKFFDNSLFKMIKDFTPARASLASGVVVKQTLLERNKYPQPEVEWARYDYSGSIDTAFIEGGPGGSTPLVTISTGYFLVLNTSLVSYITQNSSDLSFGGSLIITVSNQNGNEVLLRVGQSGGALNSVIVWSPTTENPFFKPGDIINIPTSLIGGTTDVKITLTDALIGTGLIDFQETTSQTWSGFNITPFGAAPFTQSDAVEFFNGEFSGSNFVVENGELNEANPFKQVPTTPTNYTLDLWGEEFGTSENTFLNTVVPSAGTASFWSIDIGTPVIPGNPGPYIKWVKIHKDDLQGNDNSLSLQSLESFVTNYSPTRGPFIVISISPRNGGDYFVLEFAPGNVAYSFPGPPVGNVTITNRQIVLNPYITSESGPFQNSDYNAIINNAVAERLSQWYQQVDYNTAQTVPVNFQQIISGTAYPAAVQDSNYTSYQYSGIRYWGSKNTTDEVNSPLTSQSLVVQNYQNDDIGTTTLGYPSVDRLDATILQFDWAGGTYPQIINGGILALNDLLLVGADRDAVRKYTPQQKDYLTAAEQAYPIDSFPVFNQYSTAATTTAGAQVADYGWTTPSVSNYYIPSGGFGGAYGAAMVTSSNPDKLYILDIELFGLNPPGLGSTNVLGFEVPTEATGSLITYKTISSSLALGEEWYVSMYHNLGSVASGSLQPITGSSELSQQGVYKILSVDYPGGLVPFTASLDANVNTLYSASVFGFNSLNPSGTLQFAGLLIWKTVPGYYMRVKNATLSGVGKGGLITSTPTLVVEDEFTYITQTYGTNPRNVG
jgi:hypothetical protein